jgi:hypothetical protein
MLEASLDLRLVDSLSPAVDVDTFKIQVLVEIQGFDQKLEESSRQAFLPPLARLRAADSERNIFTWG